MNARELLQTIEARGGVATLTGEGRAAKITVAPRQVARELLPELQKFKPSLLELLQLERGTARESGEEAARRELEEARLRLTRLEVAKGTAGGCRSIWRAARRLECERPGLWRRLDASDRHSLAVCVALLDAALAIEGATA